MRRLAVWCGLGTAVMFLVAAAPVQAATLCVKPGGGGGCYATISAAVAAAAPGDTVNVAHGTYAETVTVTRRISIVGEQRQNTVIDATGLAYGININGLANPGLSDVVIRGLTVAHANFEGILVTNAQDVTLSDNRLVDNNRSLNFAAATCPDILPPDTEGGEGFDCGEAIHLMGVSHSIVASNIIENNAGGVLLSDETGPTHDNLISGNTVRNNVFDCGVTLASHNAGAVVPNGVHHNTIAGNEVSGNGTLGQGAGVGMFTPFPGTAVYGNVVVGNRAIGNGLPGVAMHSHAPAQNLNDNKIIANYIADNGADDDAGTSGTTGIVVFGVSPITGTIISQNVIEREDIAVAVKTGSNVDVHLNNLNNPNVGVANIGAGTVDAIDNWWGCSRGPGAPGCSSISGAVVATPWLDQPIQLPIR